MARDGSLLHSDHLTQKGKSLKFQGQPSKLSVWGHEGSVMKVGFSDSKIVGEGCNHQFGSWLAVVQAGQELLSCTSASFAFFGVFDYGLHELSQIDY